MEKAKAAIGGGLWSLLVAAEQSAGGKWEPEEGEDILGFLKACEAGGIKMGPWAKARALAEGALIGSLSRSDPKDPEEEKSLPEPAGSAPAKAARRGI